MDLVKLTEEIVLSLVEDKDLVAVKQFDTEDNHTIVLQVMVSDKDMPKVIGRKGRVINSIRTIVQASSYTKDNKLIKIIFSFSVFLLTMIA